MKYEIDIKGLPEGWKPVAYRRTLQNEYYLTNRGVEKAPYNLDNLWLVVEKIQPRRIVLEETEEFREAVKGEFCEQEDGFIFSMIRDSVGYKYKIWREVK